MKVEGRSSKVEGRRKSEGRSAQGYLRILNHFFLKFQRGQGSIMAFSRLSGFEFRPSFDLRPSTFGLS